MKPYLLATAAVMALASCATPAAYVPIENTATIALSQDVVWSNLVEYFAENNISIKTIERDSGIIYAERSISGPGELASLASCGSAFGSAPIATTLDMNVFVRPTTDGTASRVTVNTRFHQVQANGFTNGATSTVACNSLGQIERRVLAAARGTPE